MIEEFFNDYTAGEFLDWLTDENLDEYIKEVIEEDDDEVFVANMFDVEKLKEAIRNTYKFTNRPELELEEE